MENKKKLFGISALFNTPNEIIHAAEMVTKAGYNKFDVYSSYPIHGMDKAINLKPSKLGFITLTFGLSGAFIALFSMYWAMSLDYPMIIGGKPFFAFPAFVPVAFEVTVLLATLSTVIGMLTFFFNFPHNSHPLNDTKFLKKVAGDKYGICIEADDELFEQNKVKKFLSSVNGNNVTEIYFPEKLEVNSYAPKFILFLVVVFIVVSGGTYIALNKLLFFDPFNWMQYQPRVNTQSANSFFTDNFGMRQPVEGTVSRGHLPYEFKNLKEQPANPISNPYLPSEENLSLGKKKYLTFCSPCHGNFGDGDSRLRGQFPNPPSLHSEKVRSWQDGNIYHVIAVGQNVMPSYASQLTQEESWAIINYIRVLQKAKNASESDIKEIKKENKANAK